MKFWKVFRVVAWIWFALMVAVLLRDPKQTDLWGIFLLLFATSLFLSGITKFDSEGYKTDNEKQIREMYRRKELVDSIPVSAEFIKTDTKNKRMGTLGGAAVGTFFGGPVGAVVGAVLGKGMVYSSKQTATFSVEYASGRTAIETVDVNSKRFENLRDLVK